jgi:1-acyl-sn-glycerol-3-phosphate acyltransferase
MIEKIDYYRRLACKAICFFFFGLGSLFIGGVVYPVMLILVRERSTLRKAIRDLVRGAFSTFVRLMGFFGLVYVEFENPEALREARGLIVAANHPSLIDVVILGSRIPRADCIVKQALWEMPFVRYIVRKSYIPNSLGFEETVRLCDASLAEGNSLIVFPEGTRTRPGQEPKLGRSAARIALTTGRDVLPVRIVSRYPRGLRKGDPFWSMPERGPIRFRVTALSPISVSEYAGMEPAIGARALTKRISELIIPSSDTELSHGRA